MNLERLRKTVITNPSPDRATYSKKETAALARKRDRMAVSLHNKLGLLHEIMTHESIGGRLNLGTNPEQVNWGLMPEEVAKCFWPEFEYQPEEITAFYLKYSEGDTERRIGIHFDRMHQWWSDVTAGSIVRGGGPLRGPECMGASYLLCHAPQAQPRVAREAMKSLRESLWLDSSGNMTFMLKDPLPFIIHDINELKLGENLLNFAMAEVQNRLPATPSGR